jgi:hypothetical protein
MRTMFACLCIVCLSLPALAVEPLIPNIGGSYNITGYKEPNLNGAYTYCINFTNTGTVLGFSNSGTWNVPSYGDWSGEWYRNGDEIIMHGVAAGVYIFSSKGRLLNGNKISGRQVEFFIDGSTDTAGTFYGSKITGSCAAARSGKAGDPAR